ncbi:MAG: hypothetical protein Udaeo2_12590 [Candidatus Udaeobacter sp.]|nr:MAG: hypothetical protein Udaeo2_12590 [Candidatus Udaeobacter sp.]
MQQVPIAPVEAEPRRSRIHPCVDQRDGSAGREVCANYHPCPLLRAAIARAAHDALCKCINDRVRRRCALIVEERWPDAAARSGASQARCRHSIGRTQRRDGGGRRLTDGRRSGKPMRVHEVIPKAPEMGYTGRHAGDPNVPPRSRQPIPGVVSLALAPAGSSR